MADGSKLSMWLTTHGNVMPAKAGIHKLLKVMDSRVRGHDSHVAIAQKILAQL